jgi:hypothetical protein
VSTSGKMLRLAGILSLAVALFQTVVTFDPAWSFYFGAPAELVGNYPLLVVSGLVAAVVFVVFGLYGLSGSHDIRALPLLRWGLLAIGIVYALRGLVLIQILLIRAGVVHTAHRIPPTGLASAIVSLFIGSVYLAGTISGWRVLRANLTIRKPSSISP